MALQKSQVLLTVEGSRYIWVPQQVEAEAVSWAFRGSQEELDSHFNY